MDRPRRTRTRALTVVVLPMRGHDAAIRREMAMLALLAAADEAGLGAEHRAHSGAVDPAKDDLWTHTHTTRRTRAGSR